MTIVIDRFAPHSVLGDRWEFEVGFGLTVGAAGTLGDLAESLIKRDTLNKDASQSVPGFGGFLDVLDAVIFNGATCRVLPVVPGPQRRQGERCDLDRRTVACDARYLNRTASFPTRDLRSTSLEARPAERTCDCKAFPGQDGFGPWSVIPLGRLAR